MNQDNLYAENKGCKLHWGHSQIGMNHRCQNKLLKVQDLVLYVLQKLNFLPDQLRNHGWNNLLLIRLKAKNKLEKEILLACATINLLKFWSSGLFENYNLNERS